MVGKNLSHYKILAELGRGGMGIVYKAEDEKLGRIVAIKVLPSAALSSEDDRERFFREAKAAAQLHHPHIASVFEIDEAVPEDSKDDDLRPFIAMEFIEGETLDAKIRQGPLSLDEAVRIASEIAAGLDAAHEKNIIHRDIKPANVMVTNRGSAKILDFGLAKLIGSVDLTRAGSTIGTAAYMSPEQTRGEDVDHRTDIWSLGVVLYELLTGHRPFSGDYQAAIIYSILNEAPQPPNVARADLPDEMNDLVLQALSKDRDKRIATATDLLQALETFRRDEALGSASGGTPILQALKRPKVLAALFMLLFIPALFYWLSLRSLNTKQNLSGLLPEITRAAESQNYIKAYELALKAKNFLAGDSIYQRLQPIITNYLTVLSEPEGATVYIKPLTQDPQGQESQEEYVGDTPIRNLHVARDDYFVRIEKDDYVSVERIASSELGRAESQFRPAPDIEISVTLQPETEVPVDMVHIPAGPYQLVGTGAPTTQVIELGSYLIDKYEVSNRQYKEFILAGGYTNRIYWKHLFLKGGEALGWNETIRMFVDRTGLPGPRSWSNQDFPSGQGDYPVVDISWYEASAYAAFVGKRLPTIFEWEKAARDGIVTHFEGFVMPWGLINPSQSVDRRANFSGHGPAAINSFEFGISPYGCYNMAGNVKEWIQNEITGGYVVTGGSWKDPNYLFSQYGAVDGFQSSDALGFRCAAGPIADTNEQGGVRISLDEQTPVYQPVDDATFRSLLTHYTYDKRPIDAKLVDVVETPDWTREKLTFKGLHGDQVIAYFFAPRRASKPYQILLFEPGGGVYYGENVAEHAEWILASQLKSGRAVLAVVPKGATERDWDTDRSEPEPSSVQFREEMVLHATEMRMGIDYLESREDIDMLKFAYVGFSRGAGANLGFAAIDERFQAVVFIGGGIDDRLKPNLPEADNINFAPHISVPKLMVNGKYDEEHHWFTRGLPLFNLLREPKELSLLEDGHLPSSELRSLVINTWLDKTLGPVTF